MAQASAEKLEHTGPPEKERAATERVVGKNAEAAICQKEKEQSRQSKAPDHEGGESQGGRERGEIRARAWRGKCGLHGEGRQRSRDQAKKERR